MFWTRPSEKWRCHITAEPPGSTNRNSNTGNKLIPISHTNAHDSRRLATNQAFRTDDLKRAFTDKTTHIGPQ